MVFSSIPFLYYFLPGVLLAYFIVPQKGRNAVLLFASLVFYAWGEPVYVFLMLFSIVIGYFSGLLLEKSMEEHRKYLTPKAVLGSSVFLFAGIFVFFKYTDFFISNINAVTGLSVPLLHILLPVGISFYTFQIISYLVDVYRKEVPAQKNIISLATYVAMFPQLIAGPIVRYSSVAEQIKKRRYTFGMAESGIYRFAVGLAKKVLLANELGALCETFRASQDKSVLYYWLYAVAFCLHIYFDFSGYSDMAIGLGRILGFSFTENFNYPYISASITEFWRRWHMSLGSWFRDYLYIPLGGNRVSKMKWYRNIFVVWLFTGLWHGASWNFVVWGLYFGIILIIEKKWLLRIIERTKVLRHCYALFFLLIGFVIFNATDMAQALSDIRCLLGIGDIPVVSEEALYYSKSYGVTIMISIIASTPVMALLVAKIQQKVKANPVADVAWQGLKVMTVLMLLVLSTAYLVDGSFNPFLYFRF